MKTVILIVVFAIVALIGCNNVHVAKKMDKDYIRSISFFDTSHVDHFPKTLPDDCIFLTNVPKENYTVSFVGFGLIEIELYEKYNESGFSEIKKFFVQNSIEKYSSTDSSLLLIFSYCDEILADGHLITELETPEIKEKAFRNVNFSNSLPVPLFQMEEHNRNSYCGLSSDFELYVLDAEPGKYIDEKYLQECDCLPEEWKHGYSKGVAMSDEQLVIIYWIVVW